MDLKTNDLHTMFFLGLLLFLVCCQMATAVLLRLSPSALVHQEDAGLLQSVQKIACSDCTADRSLPRAAGSPDIVLQWRLSALRKCFCVCRFSCFGLFSLVQPLRPLTVISVD
jgi:hypothetical protein